MKLDFDGSRLNYPFYNDNHKQWREWMIRPFAENEIMPYVDQWEKEGDLPEQLFKKAADAGLFQIGYPEAYGGVIEEIDIFHTFITADELALIEQIDSGLVPQEVIDDDKFSITFVKFAETKIYFKE